MDDSTGMRDELRAYAELALRIGVNLEPGQDLLIDAQIEHAPFVRVLAEEGYRLGARYVDIWYWEPHGKRARVMFAPEDTLSWTPPWLDARYHYLVERGAALVSVRGDAEPDLFADLNQQRVARDLMPALPTRVSAQQGGLVTWTIVGYPTARWAELVLGEPDTHRLWSLLRSFLRLDSPDPIEAWNARLHELKERAAILNECALDAVRFKGPGSDLTIGLLPASRWGVADLETRGGRRFIPNLPTEEVYTTPDSMRADGVITCTRPLVLDGIVIRDLRLHVESGRITRVEAASGADMVRQHQQTDAGAARLGEIALVDGSSPIGQSGYTLFTTLLDENAACHLAWGAGITTGIVDGRDMSDSELAEQGVNLSSVHVDFMVGGPEVEVIGVRKDGQEVSLLKNNAWQV